MTGDWNMTGSDQNWGDVDKMDYDYENMDYDYESEDVNYDNLENTDWFGDIVNPDCQPECQVDECSSGEACIVTSCWNPCTKETTCQQDYLQSWEMEWQEFDCSNGVIDIQPNCVEECTYEDCSAENNGETCWVEECSDNCDIYNCTIWFQQNNEWYGEVCEEEMSLLPEIRVQDVIVDSQRFVETYNDTINSILGQVCAPGDMQCQQLNQGLDAFVSGKLPVPDVENSAEVSAMGTQGAQGAAMMLGDFVNSTVADYTDMLFTPEVKSVIESAVKDTTKDMPAGSADMQAFNAFDNSNSTAEVMGSVQEEVTLGSLIGLVDMFVAEENEDDGAASWWGVFKSGLANSGQERKGGRGN